MSIKKKTPQPLAAKVPLSFEIIPNGWTREIWQGFLVLGHPQGGFVTIDFGSRSFVLGMGDPKDLPKKSVKLKLDAQDWEKDLVKKAIKAAS